MTKPRLRASLTLALLFLLLLSSLAVIPGSAEALTGNDVGTSTSTNVLSYDEASRGPFYANGRYWVFYYDGSNVVYQSSTDLSTWATKATLCSPSNALYWGVASDGTNFHVAYQSAPNTITYLRATTTSGGSISTTSATVVGGKTYTGVSVCVSDSHVYIAYKDGSTPYVTRNDNDISSGTWSATAGFPISPGVGSAAMYVRIVPDNSGGVIATWARSTTILYWRQIASDSGMSGSGPETYSTSVTATTNHGSGVMDSSGNYHAVYLDANEHFCYIKRSSSGTWDASATDLATLAVSSRAFISYDPTSGGIYALWNDAATGDIYYRLLSGGSWGSAVNWIDETSTLGNILNLNVGLVSQRGKILVSYDGGSSPLYVKIADIQATPPPVAAFTASATTGYAGATSITFTDQSTNTPTSWSWNFGDSQTSTAQNPSHTYASAGTYTVTLTATNVAGSDDEVKTGYITIYGPPTAAFTVSATTGYAGYTTFTFTDQSTGQGITTWAWNFGDSGTSSAQNPTHQYASAGTYTVTLTVTNPAGSDNEVKTGYITVYGPPTAAFSASATTGYAGTTSFVFTDASTGQGITSWSWNFGDGQTSTAQNPSHTYASAGTYTVTLTVTNPAGSDGETKTGYITVYGPPTAAFSGSPLTGYAGYTTFTFTDSSTGQGITTYAWTFGDTGTSSLQNPTHQYAAAGTYTVTLTVTNPAGSDSETKTAYITVYGPPTAQFSASPLSGVEGVTSITFTDASTGQGITTWDWDFGDGTAHSSLQNPTHVYASAGTYTVILVVTNPAGSDSETKTSYITIASALNAAFSASPLSGYAGVTSIAFTDSSTGTILSWSWTFGDGQTSTQQNPSHTYASAGVYTVTLTVTDSGGQDVETKTDYITIYGAPVAGFSVSATTGYAGVTSFTFTDSSTGQGITGWSWAFGDGQTSTSQNPSHTYASAGTYTVTLTVTNPAGSDDEVKTGLITVYGIPTAQFSASPLTGYAGFTSISFTDQSTGQGITAWLWTFGDGETSTAQSPAHTYAVAGVYTVTLRATNPAGYDEETKIEYITIYGAPVASFTLSPSSGYSGYTSFSFTDTSTGEGITTWSWTFGDTASSSAQNPTHTYASGGTFTVTLTVTNPAGSDSESHEVIVYGPPVAAYSVSSTTGYAGFTTFTFTDSSTGQGITSWSWTFGDGESSSAQNPTHQYAAAGVYTVVLTVSNLAGSDVETKTELITIYGAPTAGFSVSAVTGYAGYTTFTFTDSSSGEGITSWSWTFGDGQTSSAQSPTHQYATAGVYTVVLVVTNPAGNDGETKTDLITIYGAPVAAFSASPLTGYAGVTSITFTDASTGEGIASWSWDFGDTTSSSLQNPSHIYANPGVYTVILTVSNPAGSDGETKIEYVVIYGAPTASFTVSPESGNPSTLFQFTDTSTGQGITSWAWTFGDEDGSAEQNPNHQYATEGSFTVELVVTNPAGSDSATLVVVVDLAIILPVITSTPLTEVLENALYSYQLTADQEIVTWTLTWSGSWLSVDSEGLLSGVGHNSEVGSWAVSIKAENANGTAYQNFTVEVLNVAPSWTTSPVTSCNYDETYSYDARTDQDLYGVVYNVTSSSIHITVQADSGLVEGRILDAPTIAISLRADDGHGGVIWQNFTVTVDFLGWNARFEINTTEHLNYFIEYRAIVNESKYSFEVLSIQWNFGDGNGSKELAPSHQYAAPGDYFVQCLIQFSDGSVGQEGMVLTVGDPATVAQLIEDRDAKVRAALTISAFIAFAGYVGSCVYVHYRGRKKLQDKLIIFLISLGTCGSIALLVMSVTEGYI